MNKYKVKHKLDKTRWNLFNQHRERNIVRGEKKKQPDLPAGS
jgi:hypothetical protein